MPRGEDAPRLKLERVPGRSDKPLPAVRRLLQKVLADVEDGGQAATKIERGKQKGPPSD